jgi:hypothetical protein
MTETEKVDALRRQMEMQKACQNVFPVFGGLFLYQNSQRSARERIKTDHELYPAWSRVVARHYERLKARSCVVGMHFMFAAGVGLGIGVVAYCWRFAIQMVFG